MMLPTFLRNDVGHGYYVDVGAHAPVLYSNTCWFYKHAWRGINIDAAPGSMQLFQRKRPHDINIEALISDQETELTFYHWDTPFSVNTLSPEHARYFARLTGREPAMVILRSRPLDSILNEHLPPGQPVSFMNIDVEGHDLHVVRSNDWERFRPELVLIEDFEMTVDDPGASEIYQFMRGVGYEMYAWLRPTVVYRQVGLPDWLVPQHGSPIV
jgi:FkbM family methyltransferase